MEAMKQMPCRLPEGHKGDCSPGPLAAMEGETGRVYVGRAPFAHPSPLWDDVPPGHPCCTGTVEV